MTHKFTTKEPNFPFLGGDVNRIEFRRCYFIKGNENRDKFKIDVTINEGEKPEKGKFSNSVYFTEFTLPNPIPENPLSLLVNRQFRVMDIPELNTNLKMGNIRVINTDNIDFEVNLEFELL